jgi:Rrf2 family protein
MKLSRKCEYAFLALIDIAQHNGELVKISTISERQKIPKKFLEQILLILKGSGYLTSRRGANGGYKLATNSNEITVAEIIRLFDGALAPVGSASENFYEKTPIEEHKELLSIFKEIRNYVAEKLENTTVSDLIEN